MTGQVELLVAGAPENNGDGFEEHLEIQPGTPSVGVVEIQSKGDFERWVLSGLDLPQTRHARFHPQAQELFGAV